MISGDNKNKEDENMEKGLTLNDLQTQTFISPVMHDHSHALEEILVSTNSPNVSSGDSTNDGKKIEKNGWTEQNEKTIKRWQLDIEKVCFIYNEILSFYIRRLKIALLVALIVGAFVTILAGINSVLIFLELRWLTIMISVFIFVGNAVVIISTGLIKIQHWETRIISLTKYVEKLTTSWFQFEIELSMGADQRQNASDFIKRADGEYLYLMRETPNVTMRDYKNANNIYKERLLEEYVSFLNLKNRFDDVQTDEK